MTENENESDRTSPSTRLGEDEWRALAPEERKRRKHELMHAMRRNPTAAERELHRIVCRVLPGAKWRAQRLVCGYIADVYSRPLKMVLEADGSSHDGRADYDQARERAMLKHGIVTERFRNAEILVKSSEQRAVVSRIFTTASRLGGIPRDLRHQIQRLGLALEDPKWHPGLPRPHLHKPAPSPPKEPQRTHKPRRRDIVNAFLVELAEHGPDDWRFRAMDLLGMKRPSAHEEAKSLEHAQAAHLKSIAKEIVACRRMT